MKDRCAVVIPAYNEEATIRDVAIRTLAQISHVIIVDDGSGDGTRSKLEGLPVKLLRNDENRGKAASLWRGFECALGGGADAVITLDADGQHRPEDVPLLIAAHVRAPDRIVIAARRHDRKAAPAARYYANRFADFWIGWAAGHYLSDSQSGFRLYPADMLREVAIRHDRAASFVFESEILIAAARRGFESIAVPVAAAYPPGARRSHFHPVVDSLRITRMVAYNLVSRGMHLPGLVKSLRRSPPRIQSRCREQ